MRFVHYFHGAYFLKIGKLRTLIYTPSARKKAIQSFQTDPSVKVIVASLKAAQTAITLTAARRAVFVEFDWTPAGLEQAEDRVHRIGQDRQVEITYLFAKNTMDEHVGKLLTNKRRIVAAVMQ